jgi:hypothetical protein
MKAFIHGVNENGQDILGSGFPQGGRVTNEYKTLKNLIRYSIGNNKGKFHIEAFYNWDNNKYGKADIDKIITIY